MQRDLRALRDGAVGGVAGTATMSAVMWGAARLDLLGAAPPELITAKALDESGFRARDERTQDLLSVATHFGFGLGIGALFGLLHRRLRLPLPAPLHGALFATLVWAVSYKGWVPALRIMPPPERDRPGRPVTMIVAHWVYGATLGAVVGRR